MCRLFFQIEYVVAQSVGVGGLVGYEDKCAGVFGEGFGKRFFGEVVQVVGRLVEYEQIALFLHE